MAEEMQFPCPVCGATLRLPLEMAAIKGPCPCCGQEIIAPDPSRGLAAGVPPPEPPPTPPEDPAEPAAETDQPAASTPPESPPEMLPRRSIRLFPILITASICLLAGYFIGLRSGRNASSPAPVIPPPIPPAESVPPTPEPTSPESATEPEKPSKPIKASAAAEAALKAFLDAPDWAARAAHVLSPETVRPAMEAYSHTMPDGPVPYESVDVQNSYTDTTTGDTLFIFKVVTKTFPTGIPVAVSETNEGWLVDWQTFVEFRDDQFKEFAAGPVDKSGRFHLIVSAPSPDRAAKTENEHYSSFLLEPPFPGRQRIAYVRKSSEILASLQASTADGAVFTPVLEVAKCKTPDGRGYLVITDIVADDWRPGNH